MALAALIFANRESFRVLMACLLLGFPDVLAMRLQSVKLGSGVISVQIILRLPYLLTDVPLGGFVSRAAALTAGGISYTQKRRDEDGRAHHHRL